MKDEANGAAKAAKATLYLSDVAHAAAHEDGVMRISPNTYESKYKPVMERFIDMFGDMPLKALTPVIVDRWQKHQENRGITVNTANMYKSTASAIFNRVGRKDLADVIVLRDPGPPKSKAMSDEHFERMLRFANLRDAAMLLLLKHSGRRRATVCRLKVKDTKIWLADDGKFRLASKSVEKGNRRVLVFAGHRAALAVKLWMRSRPAPDSPFVFTHLRSGEPLLPPAITTIFHRLKKAAQIPSDVQASAHTLRHKFAQDKLEHYDAKTVAEWMGITVETLLMVYAVRTEDELERLFFEGPDDRQQRGSRQYGRW